MFNKVSIIGFGLIGSSLARGLRKYNLAEEIICVDVSEFVCSKAIELGIADFATTSVSEGVHEADLVVIAVPVNSYADIGGRLHGNLMDSCIVTDVGSVKERVIETIYPHIPPSVQFIPAHPVAGTEFSGPEAGFAELFEGRWCILSPFPESDIAAVEKIVKLWEDLGSTTEIMEPKRHDLVLAITSHLPHLIAYTIVGTATDLERHTKADVIKFSASGFRDFTRIAASDPVMWRDIFLNNRDAVLEILQRFNEDLTSLQRAIRRGEGEALFEFFSSTRDIRREIIDAGQADYPCPYENQGDPEVSKDQDKVSGSAG
jgi:cyclohexadieny/prephenate dehydrogenase